MESKLELLMRMSANISREKDLKKILAELTNVAKLLLEADRCSIFLHDPTVSQLWTIVAHGVGEIRIPDTQGIAGSVFNSGEILIIDDAYNDSRFDPDVDLKTGYKTDTMLCMPLLNKEGKSIGVFQVINKSGGLLFSKDDVSLLQHVGLYAAGSLESASLYEQLRSAHEDVIYKLSSATKFKDPETQNHIVRVGLYCEELAKSLGWSADVVYLVKLAAPMHDIGKVGIADAILQKPGPLDPDEREAMQLHTVYGHEILLGGDSKLLEIARLLALEHHEKWNGKGYPNGKMGEDISIYGRMTALADVFDALSSKRHYKEPWPAEKVSAFIKSAAGSDFDPALASLFIERFDKMMQIINEYVD